jgi:hypothetical protein
MSVLDAEDDINDIRAHVSDGSDTHEFRPLSEEEKQQFLSLVDSNAGRLFAEQTEPNSVERNMQETGVSAASELPVLSAAEQPLVPLADSSHCEVTIRNLNVRTSQLAPSRLHEQNRSVALQVILPLLVSVIVFFLVINFYPLSNSWISTSTNQADKLSDSTRNPIAILTAIPDSPPEVAKPPASDARVQSEIEVAPANQETANKESTEQTPPQVSTTVKPTAQTMRGQAKKKRGHQQRVAQLTEPSWLTGPSWSRNADSFIKFLFLWRVN